MNQTAYNGVTNFIKGLPVIGGLCKFWFIPIEEVEGWPVIDPTNQVLKTEITLKAGKVWRGPVPVPETEPGFTETCKPGDNGPYYEIKVSAPYPGDIPSSRANLDNMAYHKYIVVGKLRTSGFYVVIGNLLAGADFIADFDSGNIDKASGHNISFSTQQINKGLVLKSFNGSESGYVDFSGETIQDNNNYWELE